MLIPSQKTACLWCGKRLVANDPALWRTCVPRSDEHIIPASIGGRIKTRDVCRPCNSRFGAICDHALVRDQRIIRAAEEAGCKFTDFHETFRGMQKTEDGGQIPMRYQGGEFKPKPQLCPASDLSVPAEDWGKLRQRVRGSLIAKVRRKNLADMDEAKIASEVDTLLAAVDAEPSKEQYNKVIQERFRLTVYSGPVTVPIEMFPWETDWCLAKIVVELASLTWPPEYQIYFRPAIQIFRDFLSNLEHDPKTKTGTGIFQYTGLSDAAAKQHVVVCNLTPTRLECRLVFFGKAQWQWETKVQPIRAPPGEGWHIRIVNPLSGDDGVVERSSV